MTVTITVMTYNVHSCIGRNSRACPSKTAGVIASYNPDIIALQELDMGLFRSGLMDQAAVIAEQLKMNYHFHPSIKVEQGEYGNAIGASHHQKFVVIDGKIAFVGGLDICSNRWDDRRHLPENPERINSDDKPYEPYHDVQSYSIGPVASKMAEFFKFRWKNSGGGELHLPDLSGEDDFEIQSGLPIVIAVY